MFDRKKKKKEKEELEKWKRNPVFDKLLLHRGHTITCESYGPVDDPNDVYLVCQNCGTIIISGADFDLERIGNIMRMRGLI